MMKYTDGQYHVECREFEYLGGVTYWDYCIVNVYGETCEQDGITLRYATIKHAQKFCEELNQCPEGAVIRNLT